MFGLGGTRVLNMEEEAGHDFGWGGNALGVSELPIMGPGGVQAYPEFGEGYFLAVWP